MKRFSRLLFIAALLLLAFLAGSAMDVGTKLLAAADTSLRGVWQSWASPVLRDQKFVDVQASDAVAGRVQLLAPNLAGSVLMVGGRHRFLDRCPGFVGCLALEYDQYGRFVHAYPFRPEEYEAARVSDGLAQAVAYERSLGFDFAKHADVFAIDSYSNGDLAVVLRSELSFPPQMGIARVDRTGLPRWYRADDGSHHWPTVAHGRLRGAGAGLNDALVVPSRRVGAGMPRGLVTTMREERMGRGPCAKHFVDYLHVIDGDGNLLREISVTATLLNTRHAPMLSYVHNACDQLHLNSVEVLTAAGPFGLAAGDFLVSLRGLAALAVLDGVDGRLKRIWRGSFYGQHGARALPGPRRGATFFMFDNWGRDEQRQYPPGRLLALEARSGQERTIFPNAQSPATVWMHALGKGGVSLAPHGSRAIVFAQTHAVEVDLPSGQTTAVFQSLDDVSTLEGTRQPRQAYRWNIRGIHYVAPAGGATD